MPSIVRKGINIEFVYLDRPVTIYCNPWRFRSIIRNCLYNSTSAIKSYMYNLKRSDVDRFSEFNPMIKIYYTQTESEVQISVEDNGSGIPEDIINNLYNSPIRLNQKAGSGHGSQIVYAYLKFHSGQVKAVNLTNPTGAKVGFSFPIIT